MSRTPQGNTYEFNGTIRVMAKLTLSIDEAVVTRAKRYARQRGLSVSRLGQTYLAVVSTPPQVGEDPPVLRSLRGTLKKAGRGEYRRHLARKYR